MRAALLMLLAAAGTARAEAPIEIEGTLGALDQKSVQRALDDNSDALEVCYRSQAEKFRWLGGEAHLKVKVGKDGVVKKAWMESGNLGSWTAEKCLLARTRTMKFGIPRGGDALVELPLTFIAWNPADPADGSELEQKLPKTLEKCAGASPETAVVVYVGPGGRVKSSGFIGEVSDAWAECAVKKLAALRLRDPRGKMLKMTGRLP